MILTLVLSTFAAGLFNLSPPVVIELRDGVDVHPAPPVPSVDDLIRELRRLTAPPAVPVAPAPAKLPAASPEPAVYAPDLPKHAVRYIPARYTQSIAVTNGRDTIDPVLIAHLPDTRWHQSGGMLGLTGWRSEKYRAIAPGWNPGEAVWNLPVKNSFGSIQYNRGLARTYPVGTRFDDVLVNAVTGRVFEHRVREKVTADRWDSQVVHRDPAQFPKGYSGLKVACASCHNDAGRGNYAVGLNPGADTVFSDALPWHLVGRKVE